MKEINWVDAYSNGDIGFLKAYLLINNVIPLKHIHKFNGTKKIDLKNIDVELVKKTYPNAVIQYMTMIVDDDKNQSIVEDEETDDEIYVQGKWHSFDINIFDEDVFYLIDSGSITILYKEGDPEVLYNKLMTIMPLMEVKPKSKEIDLVAYSSGDYYTLTSEINEINADIEDNYNNDFLPVYHDIINFLDRRESGLVILRGTVGTGNLFSKNAV